MKREYKKPWINTLFFLTQDLITDLGENGTGPSGVVGTVSDTTIEGDDDFWE